MTSSLTFGSSASLERTTNPTLLKLRERLTKATAVNTTHKKAQIYVDIADEAWALEGYSAAKEKESASVLFYGHQHQLVSNYQAKLESLTDLATEFTRQSYHTSGIGLSTIDSVEIVHHNTRRFAGDLVNQLSTFDPVHGYLFSGAATNQAPFKAGFLETLNHPSGPQMTRDEIKNYFLNGADPKAQKHFVLYGLGQKTQTIPLSVTDFISVFEELHDILSLPIDTESESLREIPNHLNWMIGTLHTSILETSNFLTSFEALKQESGERLALYQTCFEEQSTVDPIQAAMDFQEKARALEAYLNAMMVDLSALQKFRERAMAAMGI